MLSKIALKMGRYCILLIFCFIIEAGRNFDMTIKNGYTVIAPGVSLELIGEISPNGKQARITQSCPTVTMCQFDQLCRPRTLPVCGPR